MYHTHRHPLTDAPSIDRLLEHLLGDSGVLGPLQAHRMGHGDGDHEYGDDAEADILAQFAEQADDLHERVVHDHGVFVAEFLGATGSGKTRLIERLIERAPDNEEIGVIVGDVAGEDDATRFRELGVSVANVNTGKECHLDPSLVEGALEELDLDALDTLYIENVGNMVCPADFPLGAQARVLVVSATEGDDVVRKHPLLFQACDGAVINKVDIAEAVNADLDLMESDVAEIAPEMPTVRTSAEHGDGLDELANFLDERGHSHASDHEAYVAGTARGHTHEHTHADGQTHEHSHEDGHEHTHD